MSQVEIRLSDKLSNPLIQSNQKDKGQQTIYKGANCKEEVNIYLNDQQSKLEGSRAFDTLGTKPGETFVVTPATESHK